MSEVRTVRTDSRSGPTSTGEIVDRLIADGNAYHCYCTAEELEATKQAAIARGVPPGGDDGRCLRLTDAERARVRT